ncbi:Na(+)-translocating NADH-quinone reductase subunit A [Roseibium sp. MMSF_3412]|uniref:Na(+)-translocating NADH-quinone reductase subunit A n=1 Tax=Roseibium sp. MMSF_3412 TaxID=3046712 RepID=UPI0027401F0D|nr:Na(+)-translocating NADH-quinone reductase subunit A [Roseibium sp. MMSF_3412]
MQSFKLKKGLDLPITGAPVQEISDERKTNSAAVLAADYIGLKPRLLVGEGDTVGVGTPLFFHKDTPDVMIVSPVAGRVRAVNRGARRVLISVVIDVEDGAAEPVDFSGVGDLGETSGLVERLCASGLWTSFRTRPYSKVPDPAARPAALFVTATDTEPLAADPAIIIGENAAAFEKGLEAIRALSDGKTYLCCETGAEIPGLSMSGIEVAGFSGPHPAGLAGTHIHFLDAPSAEKTIWSIGYQDVIAIGKMLETGHYDPSRVIALSGPRCARPRLVRTIAGASMEELADGEITGDEPVRLISGSVLSGRLGEGPSAYLGRYARQVTLIEEDHKQIPMGWILPMPSKYAFQPVLGSAFSKKLYALTSNLNGGRRAMVPLGTFEELMPQDYLPTQLLRALLVMDTDQAQALGALELDEEDLGLVGFACPAKYEYGIALRDCLMKIEKEG